MLRFEKLELSGFKSFADKLEVNFNDRVTAVVGPNGCGKSNLFDAIGWVLGSQSPRSLRGEKMEDVIFSGSKRRKPSGLAQVALTLRRDPDRTVSIKGRELDGDVLEVCRKLYRSGESHYLINRKRCRLKDIQQVLEELGLGFASYALIPQGRIDSFLTGKPSDRRAIIEEAARILSYKSRRRSAEVKLEMAQQNLLRVADIISEVERRLRSLKRQAAKARRYKEIKAEFRRVQRQKLKLESDHLQQQLVQCSRQLKELENRRQANEESLAQAQQHYRTAARRREELEEKLNQLKQQRTDLMLEADRAGSAIQHHQEQIESTTRYIESTSHEQASIRAALEKLEAELDLFRDEEQQLEAETGRLAEQLSQQSQTLTSRAQEVDAIEARIDQLTTRQVQLTAQQASWENLKSQLETRLQQWSHQQQALENTLQKAQLETETTRQEISSRRGQLQEHQEQIQILKQEIDDTEVQRTAVQRQLGQFQQQHSENHERLIALRERVQSLEEVQLNHSQYSEGVRKFLNHLSKSQSVNAKGTLADLLETDSRYEHLVEGFLEEELEFVLVDSMQEAIRGLSELKHLNSGKCTFLALTPNGFGEFEPAASQYSQLAREPGVLGPLHSLLHMEPEVEHAFSRVLPQQAEAVVVSDLGRALDLAHSYPSTTFVTLEGETLSPRGLLAATSQNSKKLGLLSLKRQKKQLQGKIEELVKEQAHVAGQEKQLSQELEALIQQRDQTQDKIHQMEKAALTLQHQIAQVESELERLQSQHQAACEEMDRVRSEQESSSARLKEAVQRHGEREKELRETEGSLEQSRESLKRVRSEWEELQQQYHNMSSSRQVVEERRAALQRTLTRVKEQRDGLQQRQREAEQALKRSHDLIEQRTRELEQLTQKWKLAQQKTGQIEARLSSVKTEYQEARQSIPGLEEQVEKLSEERAELQEEASQLQVERARWETQLQSLDQLSREQLQASLVEAVQDVVAEGSLKDVNVRYDQLRQRLDSFGPINMTALQEYQESEERYTFLTNQRSDIESSIADTERAIQDLNRRSLEQFQQAFDAVNRHFKEFFQRLFGGGDCGMRLLDEEDVLESGIEIYAQPPGKRLQNVMLLSGGEKALTVLALLMGLFAYRPSKFCVLDEVDAPLDDANVIRYTNLIREMSEQTQLILITHNKRTMQVADALYGVTMSEPGISQVVSVQMT